MQTTTHFLISHQAPITKMSGIYILDHACFKPPEDYRVVARELEEKGKEWPMYSESMKDFMWKVFVKSGIGAESTFLPPAIHPKHTKLPKANMSTAMVEAEMVMGGALTDLLERTGLKPTDIDILVTCCSIFCPTPSLASMLVNKFKMRSDVQSYHLGGMGCGTGVVGITLCQDLLKAHPNKICVFVPSEITTYCFYPGLEKNRMVANAIFRMGGAAIALTNKPSLKSRCKYELVATTRVHTGADDSAYNCMSWGPDSAGVNGVYLGKDVVSSASKAIKWALTDITPKIMNWTQYVEAALNITQKRLGYEVPDYRPDYTQVCNHFCLHAGGYAVLKGLQDALKLPSSNMIPSFAGLREYGNTSCSTTWYSMAYLESCGGVSKGQRILQLGVGGGMKAGINVWKVLRDVNIRHSVWDHVADKPLTEADLPRGVDGGDIRDPELAKIATAGAAESAVRAKAALISADARAMGAVQEEEQLIETGH